MTAGAATIDRPRDAYRPQLDGLRAIAVSQVLLHHLWPQLPSLGHRGVQLFFVLSGFLITGLLLEGRAAAGAGAAPGRWFVLRRFYVRRLLRIAPAYYALLLVLLLVPGSGVRGTILVHALYLSNFYFAWTHAFLPWPVSHLWTLAVEEQFYLLWPLLILTSPGRWLKAVVLLTVASGPAFRGAAWYAGIDVHVALWVLPFSSLDALALGALLALVRDEPRLRRAMEWAAAAGALAVVAFQLLIRTGVAPYHFGFDAAAMEFAWALAFAGLVSRADAGLRSVPGAVLSSRPLVRIGRLSYGIYLYHVPVHFLVYTALGPQERMPFPVTGPVAFVVVSSLTLLVAAISWHGLEAPLQRLKRHFPYRPRPQAASGA